MPITFDTQTLTIGNLFSGDALFQMPAFQRPYSWQEEQVLQLYDDLNTYYLNQEKAHETDFFLGPIVVADNNSHGPTDVVDGQQRLVTLSFILAVLRDLSTNEQFKDDINAIIWRAGTTLYSTEDVPRVKLRAQDQTKMLQWVHHKGGTRNLPEKAENESTQNLLNNIKSLKTEIGDTQDEYIEGLAKYILNNCYVIKIISKDSFEAYKIFKSINTIGQPLTELDIIRGEILNPQYDHFEQAKDIAGIWDRIEEELGLDELSEYIKLVLSTIDRDYASQDLRQVFRKIFSNPQKLQEFRQKLINFISSYDQLNSAQLDYGSDSAIINRHIKCLKQASFDNWYTTALLWLTRKRTPRESLKFFRALDALCLGLTITKSRKLEIKRRFQKIEQRINNEDVLSSAVSELYLTGRERSAILEILDQPIKAREKFLKPLLTRINVEMQDSSIPIYFPKDITLEHVLPQKPKSNSLWLEHFPDEDRRFKACNSLGNFAILNQKINARIKNSEFENKKKMIFSTKDAQIFALNTDLTNYEFWDQNSVNRRHTQLMNIAKHIMFVE